MGQAMDTINPEGANPDFFRYLEQAYVSVKPATWKGLQADFGEFVTSAGAEVIESKENWNYSRSLLFALAIPYYHFGLRTSVPIGKSFNFGVQLVNGWNTIIDTHGNNLQTVGFSGTFTRKSYSWAHNFYVGPQYTASGNRTRSLYDTTWKMTMSKRAEAYLNVDYGWQSNPTTRKSDRWVGAAAALRLQISSRFAITPRVEYFDDEEGLTTGTAQQLHEITVTGEYSMMSGLLSRLEYRHDASTAPFFYHGSIPASAASQDTVTLGLIAYFPYRH